MISKDSPKYERSRRRNLGAIAIDVKLAKFHEQLPSLEAALEHMKSRERVVEQIRHYELSDEEILKTASELPY